MANRGRPRKNASGVYVPSLGRPANMPTVRMLNEAGIVPTVVVQAHEVAVYHRSMRTYDFELEVLPPEIKTIAPTRQYILGLNATRSVVMMDDDLQFSTYRGDGKTFTKSTEGEVWEAVMKLFDLLEEFAHAGIGSRQGANYAVKDCDPHETIKGRRVLVHQVTRMQRVLGYNVPTVRRAKASFTRIEPLSDFDMTLQLLRAGFANAVMYDYVQDEVTGGFQAEGGCSLWRTMEKLRAAQKKLISLHPDFISARERTYVDRPSRTELTIQWKKAFTSSRTDS